MAELANPLCWATRAIGFDAFGWHTTFFERARVFLVRLFCVADPPLVCILRCMKWSHHKLKDHTDHMRLVQILPRKPFVLFSLPCQLVAKLLEGRDRIRMAKESVRKERIYLGRREYKGEHTHLPRSRGNGMRSRRESVTQVVVVINCVVELVMPVVRGQGKKKLSRPPLQSTSASALHNYHSQVAALPLPSSSLCKWAP
jgi:hypothetical protein